jgi:5-formaminoimidazole-4-carboxamide-1-beta-D-ribofuranosyl 5'-monophosphate synthetase
MKKGVKKVKAASSKKSKKQYVIVRSKSAGVFAGYIKSKSEQTVVMINVRRLWHWEGANSLSQLAMEGTKKPSECQFPCEMDIDEIFEVIEIIDVTDIAKKSIDGVPVWKQ